MYEKEKSIRTQRTKQAILQAVIALSKEKPFASIRVSEVAEKAGINRKTFYVYYSGMDDYIVQLRADLADTFRPLLAEVNLTGTTFDTHWFFREAIAIVRKDMEIYRMFFSANMMSLLLEYFQEKMLEVFLNQYDSDDPLRRERYRLLGKYAGAGLLSAATEWVVHPNMPLEDFADLMGSISLSAFRIVEEL